MNRRTFTQSLVAGLVAVFVPWRMPRTKATEYTQAEFPKSKPRYLKARTFPEQASVRMEIGTYIRNEDGRIVAIAGENIEAGEGIRWESYQGVPIMLRAKLDPTS